MASPKQRTGLLVLALAWAAGWLLRSEVRDLEELPPVGGLDDPPEPPPAPEIPAFNDRSWIVPPDGVRSEADLWIYWTAGKGKAKWATSPQPLTALYEQLLKHFTPERARFTALSWAARAYVSVIRGTPT